MSTLPDLLAHISRTALELSKHDAYMSWRLSGQFGYPRTEWERSGATTVYAKLLDEQLQNLEELRRKTCRSQ